MMVEMLVRRVVDGRVQFSIEMVDTKGDSECVTLTNSRKAYCTGCGFTFPKMHSHQPPSYGQVWWTILLSPEERPLSR
jgi:hypothetical protein